MFGNRLSDTGNIYLLEGILTQKRSGHLASYSYYRHRIKASIGNAGYQVGCPRARGRHAYPHLSGGSGITVSRMGSTLLMTDQNMAKLRVLRQGII